MSNRGGRDIDIDCCCASAQSSSCPLFVGSMALVSPQQEAVLRRQRPRGSDELYFLSSALLRGSSCAPSGRIGVSVGGVPPREKVREQKVPTRIANTHDVMEPWLACSKTYSSCSFGRVTPASLEEQVSRHVSMTLLQHRRATLQGGMGWWPHWTCPREL